MLQIVSPRFSWIEFKDMFIHCLHFLWLFMSISKFINLIIPPSWSWISQFEHFYCEIISRPSLWKIMNHFLSMIKLVSFSFVIILMNISCPWTLLKSSVHLFSHFLRFNHCSKYECFCIYSSSHKEWGLLKNLPLSNTIRLKICFHPGGHVEEPRSSGAKDKLDRNFFTLGSHPVIHHIITFQGGVDSTNILTSFIPVTTTNFHSLLWQKIVVYCFKMSIWIFCCIVETMLKNVIVWQQFIIDL
jgi:hypothetical protein